MNHDSSKDLREFREWQVDHQQQQRRAAREREPRGPDHGPGLPDM